MGTNNSAPRYRRLRSTGAHIFWHPCAVCGSLDAPYGFNVTRRSGAGQWVDERDPISKRKTGRKVWKGKDATTTFGTWYCRNHRHIGEASLHGETQPPTSSISLAAASPSSAG